MSIETISNQVIELLKKMNLRVPEDVQVIGFDGVPSFFKEDYICSTIVQPVKQIAQTCVELLLAKELAKRSSLVCLPVSYAYGGTTKE